MRNYQDVIQYIVKNHPDPCSLSSARVSVILYLIDWKSSMETGRQLTNLVWHTTPSGIKPEGGLSSPFSSKEYKVQPSREFSDEEKHIMDHAINSSAKKGIKELISLANATYPAFLQNKIGTVLKLDDIAKVYRERKSEIAWSNKLVSDQDWHSAEAISKF